MYVARCLEIEATSQGETVEQALDNLCEVVEVHLRIGMTAEEFTELLR